MHLYEAGSLVVTLGIPFLQGGADVNYLRPLRCLAHQRLKNDHLHIYRVNLFVDYKNVLAGLKNRRCNKLCERLNCL